MATLKTTLILPSQFEATSLFHNVGQQLLSWALPPEEVIMDFSRLSFVRPSGVVFTSNLTHFLAAQGCKVSYDGLDKGQNALKYLDDSQFFKQHVGEQLHSTTRVRPTTLPLVQIAQTDVAAWLEYNLVPWLVGCTGRSQEAFSELRTCIYEVFNNISEHSTLRTGSVFCQWYPKENRLRIAIADFGSGIPVTVRSIRPELDDNACIRQAFVDGFSAKSIPQNRGAGLHFLRQNIVENFGGELRVLSLRGGGQFAGSSAAATFVQYSQGGFCPGTLIELELRTDLLDAEPYGGAFEW
jgi:anti-sigma regulatory factor (Ser/Thr protein kinase)